MILLVALICCTITLPTLFEWKADEIVGSPSREMIIVSTELGTNALFRSLYYWFTVVAFVFIPLTILTIFNLFLIRSVRKSSQKRRQWISSTTAHSGSISEAPQKVPVARKPALISGSLVQHPTTTRTSIQGPKSRSLIRLTLRSTKQKVKPTPSKAKESDFFTPTYRILLRQDAHITRLLIAVVLFFLVCQLPSALVIIYTTTATGNGEEVTNERQDAVLKILGNIVNLLMAVNSAGNFMLYCLLSRKYRRTLRDLLVRIGKRKN